jgi:hypothetical protein
MSIAEFMPFVVIVSVMVDWLRVDAAGFLAVWKYILWVLFAVVLGCFEHALGDTVRQCFTALGTPLTMSFRVTWDRSHAAVRLGVQVIFIRNIAEFPFRVESQSVFRNGSLASL